MVIEETRLEREFASGRMNTHKHARAGMDKEGPMEHMHLLIREKGDFEHAGVKTILIYKFLGRPTAREDSG